MQIWFDHVRVPYDALLDRFASVDATTGCYSSPIASNTARFGAMVGALTLGRVLLAQVSKMSSFHCQISMLAATQIPFTQYAMCCCARPGVGNLLQ